MIVPIVHLRDDTSDLIMDMIRVVDLYRVAPPGGFVRILAARMGLGGWGGMLHGSVNVLRDTRGRLVVSTGLPHDSTTIVLDEGMPNWDPASERPTLDQIRELLVTISQGRMRRDDDPIEILAKDLAVQMSLSPPVRRGTPSSGMLSAPRVVVEAPGRREGSARVAWVGPIGLDVDEGYRPSPGLARRISTLPTEIAVSCVKKAMTCSMRTHNALISRRDTIDTLRAMAHTTLAPDEFLEKRS